MIFHKTFIKVIDNSGAIYAKCVKILKTNSAYGKIKKATIGDIILVTIRFYIPHKKIKKGNLFKALVVKTKSKIKRDIGSLCFSANGVVLLDRKMQPVGTKIFGPIARESKLKRFNKLSTFAKIIL
jgi:large subunit ribosomal protein L14